MDHSWFKNADAALIEGGGLNSSVITNLKKFKGRSLLKKQAINILVKHLKSCQIKEL